MEWNDEKISLLIKRYEGNSCLYDVKSDAYHNRTKKRAVLQRIAAEFETTETEVSKKLKYLRSQFGEEKRKEGTSRSGMSSDDIYESKWKFYRELAFLDSFIIQKKKTLNNIEMFDDENREPGEQLEVEYNTQPIGSFSTSASNPNSSLSELVENSTKECEPSKPAVASKRRKTAQPSSSDSGMEVLQQYLAARVQAMSACSQQTPREDDDDMLFAKMVGAEMKTIKSSAIKRSLKKSITDAIYMAQEKDSENVVQYYVVESDGGFKLQDQNPTRAEL